MKEYIHGKIHLATVTQADINYVGSITIDSALLDKTGLEVGQKVLVTSATSGARLETYIIAGEPDSGVICMNGPAAHLVKAGEVVVIMGFILAEVAPKPKVILVDAQNKFIRYLAG